MPKEFLSNVDLNGNKITELGTPSAATDAATKQYVDDNAGTEIAQQTSAPSSPVAGDLWLDTDEGAGVGLSSIIAYAQVTANQTGILGTEVDLNGLSVSVTVPAGRRLKITAWAGPGLSSSVTGDKAYMVLTNGANGFLAYEEKFVNNNHAIAFTAMAVVSPAAGTHTFKMRAGRSSGTGTVTLTTSASNPAFILVEDITGTLWPVGAPINGSMLAADTISSTELQANSVGTSELQDNSVTAAKIPLGVIPENRLDSALQTKIGRAVESPQTNLTMQADSHVVMSDSPNGYLNITYPSSFGVTPQCVVLTNGEDGQGVFLFSMVFRNAGSFTARLRNTSGGIAVGYLVRLNWIACV